MLGGGDLKSLKQNLATYNKSSEISYDLLLLLLSLFATELLPPVSRVQVEQSICPGFDPMYSLPLSG